MVTLWYNLESALVLVGTNRKSSSTMYSTSKSENPIDCMVWLWYPVSLSHLPSHATTSFLYLQSTFILWSNPLWWCPSISSFSWNIRVESTWRGGWSSIASTDTTSSTLESIASVFSHSHKKIFRQSNGINCRDPCALLSFNFLLSMVQSTLHWIHNNTSFDGCIVYVSFVMLLASLKSNMAVFSLLESVPYHVASEAFCWLLPNDPKLLTKQRVRWCSSLVNNVTLLLLCLFRFAHFYCFVETWSSVRSSHLVWSRATRSARQPADVSRTWPVS